MSKVGQTEWTNTRRSLLRLCSLPILHHTSVQPLLDVSQHTLVCYPMLDELHQPFVVDGIDEEGVT